LFLIAFNACAQKLDMSSHEVYEAMNSAGYAHKREIENNQCPSNDNGLFVLCITENSKKRDQLMATLRQRADSGEPVASFYLGIMVVESEKSRINVTSDISIKARNQSYQIAINYYKKACAGGVSNGCWNIANILLNGYGETTSGLAAAEWFYKAGSGYLAAGDRDRALSALEEIQKIESTHPLGKKLFAQLQKGMPK